MRTQRRWRSDHSKWSLTRSWFTGLSGSLRSVIFSSSSSSNSTSVSWILMLRHVTS